MQSSCLSLETHIPVFHMVLVNNAKSDLQKTTFCTRVRVYGFKDSNIKLACFQHALRQAKQGVNQTTLKNEIVSFKKMGKGPDRHSNIHGLKRNLMNKVSRRDEFC